MCNTQLIKKYKQQFGLSLLIKETEVFNMRLCDNYSNYFNIMFLLSREN